MEVVLISMLQQLRHAQRLTVTRAHQVWDLKLISRKVSLQSAMRTSFMVWTGTMSIRWVCLAGSAPRNQKVQAVEKHVDRQGNRPRYYLILGVVPPMVAPPACRSIMN